jgi:hypothetical protein
VKGDILVGVHGSPDGSYLSSVISINESGELSPGFSPIPGGESIDAVTVDPNGDVYYLANTLGTESIGEADGSTGANIAYANTVPDQFGDILVFILGNLAWGPNGSLYAASNQGSTNQQTVTNIFRINPKTLKATNLQVNGVRNLGSGFLSLIGFGQDGQLYYTGDYFEGNGVYAYNLSTGISSLFIADYSGRSVFGPNGNLYMQSGDSVLEYSGTDGSLMGTFIPSGYGGLYSPIDMFFGNDGDFYIGNVEAPVGEYSAGDDILRYDANTGQYLGVYTSNTDDFGLFESMAFLPEPSAGMLFLGLIPLLRRPARR